jgi:tRNA1(Val) A37 N6-methylase TrmN6
MPAADVDVTEDAVLGGRLWLRQPRRGHRVGHDAMLLAASTGGAYGERAVEFGAGVGGAGFALARRIPGLRVTLVEIDPALCELARQNAVLNRLDERVSVVTGDVTSEQLFSSGALVSGQADRVLMNPPFNDPERQQTSPDAARKLAHAARPDTLESWFSAAARALKPSGVLTMIWRAEGIADVTAALAREFGAATILPVHPRPAAPAIRILVRAVKDATAPLVMLPGLMLNDAQGRPSAEAEAVLRAGEVLPLANL